MSDAVDRKFVCRECKVQTNHRIMHKEQIRRDDNEFFSVDIYRLIQCRGCDSVSFQHSSFFSEDINLDGSLEERIAIYPAPDNGRTAVLAFKHFPTDVGRIYDELIATANADARTMSAIGVRALVEAVCIDQKCQARNLERRIDELVDRGVLSRSQADFLHLTRFMGNSAAHEMTTPTATELEAALDIVENLLRTLYELPRLAGMLGRRNQPPEAAGHTIVEG